MANVRVNIGQMFDPGRGDRPIEVELAPIRNGACLIKFYLIKNGKLYKTVHFH